MRDLLFGFSITDSELQFAANPKFSAVQDDCPLKEWAVKAEVSMPAAFNRAFSHLAMVLEVTALYGFIKAKITRFFSPV